MKLVVDNRIANLNEDIAYENIDTGKAFDVLDMLDSQKHTLMTFDRADGWQLCVGGGVDYFIVTASSSNGKNLTLLNLEGDDCETIELCAGGQFADFPRSIIVDKDVTIKAIYSFFEGSEQNLDWDEE